MLLSTSADDKLSYFLVQALALSTHITKISGASNVYLVHFSSSSALILSLSVKTKILCGCKLHAVGATSPASSILSIFSCSTALPLNFLHEYLSLISFSNFIFIAPFVVIF